MSLSSGYAMAKRDAVTVNVSISGGTAPYTVALYAMNGSNVAYESTGEQTGNFTTSYTPAAYGVHELTVSVTDAAGATGMAHASLEAAVNEQEWEGEWEQMAAAVRLTGDWRTDLLAFAETQVGYEANKRNYVYNEDGMRSYYTRYGDWFGLEYSEWCAMFVSFCLNYIDVEEQDFPFGHNCVEMKKELEYLGAYMDIETGYQPQPGDLVMFDWEDDDRLDHIGIFVQEIEGGIETIEGNVGNKVVHTTHGYWENTIAGYVNLKVLEERAAMRKRVEQAEAAEPAAPVTGNVSGITARTNTDRVNMRAEANTDCAVVAKLASAGTVVTILESVDMGDYVWYKVDYEGQIGYVRSDLMLPDSAPEATAEPTVEPTAEPTMEPTAEPTAEPTVEPTAEPTMEPTAEPVQPEAAAWDGKSNEAAVNFIVDGAAAYRWEKLVDGEWIAVEGAEASELKVEANAETMKYAYRCTAVLTDGSELISEEITLVREDIAQWLNETEVTEEMLARAVQAKSLDTLVIEGANVVHVRTNETVAYYDAETGCIIDAKSGMEVAWLDAETGMIYPISMKEESAE